MNDYQKAILKSHEQVVTIAKSKPEILMTIPYFEDGVNKMAEIVIEIKDLSVIQDRDLTGITEDKTDLHNEVIDSLIEISGAVHAYAGKQGNKTLQALVNYKPSKVAHMDAHELIDACSNTVVEARKIPEADLAETGITSAEITEFDSILTRLKGSTGLRRTAVIDKKDITRRIAQLFAAAADIKKNTLERLAPQFQRKAPEFYNTYKDAANVIYHRSAPQKTLDLNAPTV